MGALKQAKNLNSADINLINGDTYVLDTGYPSGVYVPSVNQGLPTLIVMVVVLVIIMLFCFWGAPAVRAFCKRKICCCCPMDEPNADNVREDELNDYVLVSKRSKRSRRHSHRESARRTDQHLPQ
ncbi:hypothetical protein RN001_000632 [Aquatica leii]|uniref:Uncharacterized protein n=1 Tax=Aquatica leii TaxID=1421715 RepID=A0AAN7PMI8_9COLE|nr:hypothetical protein RN001_000632 [Aquatica leii]